MRSAFAGSAGPGYRLVAWLLVISLMAGCGTTLDGAFSRGEGGGWENSRWAGLRLERAGRPLAPGRYTALQRGDYIVTDANTYALIRFEAGAEAYLAPGSSATIASLSSFLGEVLVKIERLQGRFEVKTEFITAGAKGTVFLVHAEPDGRAWVSVLQGVVRVASNAGRWPEQDLQPGERADFFRDRPPTRRPMSEPDVRDIQRRYEPLEQAAPPGKGVVIGAGLGLAVVAGVVISRAGRGGGGGQGGGNAPVGTATRGP